MTDKPENIFLLNENEDLNSFFNENRDSSLKWIYLGRNVNLALDIENKYGNDFQRLCISQRLQNAAKEYRQEYIDFIGKQALLNADSWWLTAISEKNIYISNIYLYICYLMVSIEYIKNNTNHLLIICESEHIIEILENYCNENYLAVHRYYNKNQSKKVITLHFKYLTSKLKFIAKYFGRITLSKVYTISKRRALKIKYASDNYILQTWVDSRFFINNNNYSDTFFGPLSSFLKKHNKDYIYVIDILPNIFYLSAIIQLLKVKEPFILRESNIGIVDVFKSIYYVKKKFRPIKISGDFRDFNLENIFYEELNREMLESRAEFSYLINISSKNISKKTGIKKYIYIFENHMWEKALIKSLRESTPNTETIAYAHPVVNSTYTCYSVSEFEKLLMPQPDTIITNGPMAKKVLSESGFDEKKIFVAGALRFSNLFNKQQNFESMSSDKKIILLACSANIFETREIIHKSIPAFGSMQNCNVFIKLHPNVRKNVLKGIISKLPQNFSFIDEPMDNLLNKVSLTVYTSSSVCIESILRNVPVVHVKSDYIIDMNAFEGYDMFYSVSSPEELKQATIQIFSNDNYISGKMKEIAANHFIKVTEEGLSILL